MRGGFGAWLGGSSIDSLISLSGKCIRFLLFRKQPTVSFPSSRMTLVVFFKDLAFTLAIVGHPSAAKEPGHRRTMVTHGNGLIMFT